MHSFPVTQSSISFNTDTALLLLKVGLYRIINRFKKSGPLKILKKKYDIDLSLGDTLINEEGLNIVYTSKHMKPNIYTSKNNFTFVGPSLFFKKEQSDFPFNKLKNKKVVYISLGTLLTDNSKFYKKCIKAFLNKEYYTVLSIGFDVDINIFGDLPENFLIRQSVPQQRLLKYVDLFITHAGMNSVNEAICFGVPMLLLPHTFEEKLIANKVMTMGIGMIMNIKNITSTKIYDNAKKLISDLSYKKQALEHRSKFNKEEKTSHIKAANEILRYIDKQF